MSGSRERSGYGSAGSKLPPRCGPQHSERTHDGRSGSPVIAVHSEPRLPLLAVVWYRVSVVATDDWAGSVRAMVNLGRQPLAASMGLELPKAITDERIMWRLAVEFVRNPYTPEMTALDQFRAVADAPDEKNQTAAIAARHSSPIRISAHRKRLRR